MAGTRAWRAPALYLGIILGAVLTLVLALPQGNEIVVAPQAPPVATVRQPASRCLGGHVAFDQSGVFVALRTSGGSTGGSSADPGALIAEGRLDRRTGAGTLEGRCAPGAALAGDAVTVTLRLPRDDTSISGTLELATGSTPLVMEAVDAGGPPGGGEPEERLSRGEVTTRVLLAVAVIVVAARAIGTLMTRFRQPRVVGEIVAGILLGPSLLGLVAPDAVAYLFPAEATEVLGVMAQFGLVFFMFFIGVELDHARVRRAAHSALLISHVSIALPFALGVVLALWLYPLLGQGEFVSFALFLGAAMAITAFPVLARILTDTGLDRSRIGALALACAAVDDVTAWCLLAAIVGMANASGAVEGIRVAALSVAYVVAMIWVVRPIIHRLISVHELRGRPSQTPTAAILAVLLLSAWTTEQIGIHAIFGAFLAGAVMPRSSRLLDVVTSRLEDVTVLFLLPIFFAVVGLSTRFGLVDRLELWVAALLVLGVAVLGKWGGSMLAARATGWGWRASTAIGILMNTRGLTEIIILTIGRELGILSPALFTIMVMMALVTTVMATPLLAAVYPSGLVDRQVARAAAARRVGQGDRRDQRVVVGVDNPDDASGVLDVVAHLRTTTGEPPIVVLALLGPRQERHDLSMNVRHRDAGAAASLEPLAAPLRASGFEVVVAGAVADDPATELARLAKSHDASLLVVGQHHAYFGSNPLGGVVGDLLTLAPCDVAVVFDPPPAGDRRDTDAHVAVVYDDPSGDAAALDLAVALARGTDQPLVRLDLLHPDRTGDAVRPTAPDGEPGPAVVHLAAGDDEAALAAASKASVVVAGTGAAGASRLAALAATVTTVIVVQARPATPTRSGAAVGRQPAVREPVRP